jgi:hypothetical protein
MRLDREDTERCLFVKQVEILKIVTRPVSVSIYNKIRVSFHAVSDSQHLSFHESDHFTSSKWIVKNEEWRVRIRFCLDNTITIHSQKENTKVDKEMYDVFMKCIFRVIRMIFASPKFFVVCFIVSPKPFIR